MASEGQQTKMPDKDTYIDFEKLNTKLPCPFVIYGDFECLTTNSNNDINGTYQEHKPCGYMLNVVSRIDNTCQPYLYRGEDCMKHFVEKLREIKKDIFAKMNVNEPMDELTFQQKTEFTQPNSLYVIRNSNLMTRKSATTATSQGNTEAQRM